MHCNNCEQVVSNDDKFCRSCGAAVQSDTNISSANVALETDEKKGYSNGQVVGACFALLLITLLVIYAGAPNNSSSSENEMSVSDDLTADADRALINSISPNDSSVAISGANWEYSNNVDKVRGGTSYYAETTSTNSVSQDPPYDSDTRMRMTVRKAPAFGTDVIFTITSGQLLCPSYEGCSGTASFDGGPAERISFNGPADNSSDTIFVEGAPSFIAKLKKAKKLVLEKTLYQAGSPQFEFNVAGLKWDH